jgi:hypothetical protein
LRSVLGLRGAASALFPTVSNMLMISLAAVWLTGPATPTRKAYAIAGPLAMPDPVEVVSYSTTSSPAAKKVRISNNRPV